MRFNEKDMMKLSETKADLEGILHHMKPQGNEWSDWYQQPSFKERYFKLIANLLFYYRVNEQEPVGVLVLENAQVAYERPHRGIPFAFSMTFKVNDKFRDNEAKHIFSCRCDSDVNKWVSALKVSSYEYWRSQCIILRTKIGMKTGKDPVLEYLKNQTSTNIKVKMEVNKTEVKETKSTFYSNLETISSTFYESSICSSSEVITSNHQTSSNTVENLITL